MIDAETPADRCDQLIALTRSLTARLAAERAALAEGAVLRVAEGVEETQRLANLYRRECLALKADPQRLAGTQPQQRQTLKAATDAFDQEARRHLHAVEAARTVSEGLMRSIAEEITRAAAPTAYGPAGGSERRAAAIAVDRRT